MFDWKTHQNIQKFRDMLLPLMAGRSSFWEIALRNSGLQRRQRRSNPVIRSLHTSTVRLLYTSPLPSFNRDDEGGFFMDRRLELSFLHYTVYYANG
jgi:hypothetical protein